MYCDVGDPKLIGPLGAEVAIDQIGRWSGIAVTNSCGRRFPARKALNLTLVHQSCNALSGNVTTFLAQIGMETRATVRRLRRTKQRLNPIAQKQIALATRRRRALAPGVAAALGDF